METKAPKRKRTFQKLQLPLPGFRVHPLTDEIIPNEIFYGIFNGFGVTISDSHAIKEIYNNGYFGKGSLSRSAPRNKDTVEILRQRQYLNRERLKSENRSLEKCIVLPDSDDEVIETDLNKLQITYPDLSSFVKDTVPVKETLLLTLEEAFFLFYGVGCLKIKNESDEVLCLDDVWSLFKSTQSDFVYKYVVYHYFRSKQWVVKPGLKYGSDFLLYKDGPTFYHASYAVKIQVFYNKKNNESQDRLLSRNQISALTRLTSSSGKEVILAHVFYPPDFDEDLKSINNINVEEILLRRIFLKDLMTK